jgi:hypothetical protein
MEVSVIHKGLTFGSGLRPTVMPITIYTADIADPCKV